MYVWRLSIALSAVALACTPKLSGVCKTSADCKSGEWCSGDGICLSTSLSSGDGGGSASVDILSPASGAFEKGTFHVSAQASSFAPIQDVTFYLSNSSSGADLGHVAGVQASSTWSADLTVNASAFGGSADLVAVLHRSGLADVVSAKVTVIVDQNAPTISPSWDAGGWWALDAGINVTAAVADDRSGVASAELALPDGGFYSASISSGTATFQIPAIQVGSPGTAVAVPVTLTATDRAGNRGGGASVASKLQVDAQPPTISVQPIASTAWFSSAVDVNANLDDAAGSGVASASVLVNSAFTTGIPDGGGGYYFHTDLTALPPTEAPVAMQVIGADNVGNQADAGFSINVDNVPPVITSAQIDTQPDGVDSANQGWFQGPTAAPSAGPISVSAVVSDTNLVTSGANAPAAVVGGARYAGTLNAGRWTFSIPRSVGKNANGPVTVAFDAQDLAGNHPASPPWLPLQFDDVPPSSFTPNVVTDQNWYARSGSVPVSVSFSAAPRSGFKSIVLRVSGQADVTGTLSYPNWSANLPATYAPAGREAPFSFSVVTTSVTNLSSTGNGSRSIDDVAPVISNTAAVPYPASGSWGHDGSHFTLRDSGTIYTFTAYDCGSGLHGVLAAFAFSPQLATRNYRIVNSGTTASCGAPIYNVSITGDLSTSAPGSFSGADNALSATVSATVQDVVGHTAASSTGVNVTRRLWQTGNISASSLAVGPVLIAASSSGNMTALNRSDGSTAWSSSNTSGLLSGPAIGGSASNPLLYYGVNGSVGAASFFAVSASTGAAQLSCNTLCKPTRPAGCSTTGGYLRNLQFLAVATNGSAVVLEDDTSMGTMSTGVDCGAGGYAIWDVGASCPASANVVPTTTTQTSTSTFPGAGTAGLGLGRSGRAFYAVNGPNEIALTGGTVVNGGATCGALSSISDNAGSDAPLCGGQRLSFNGAFSTLWSASMSSPIDAGGVVLSNNGAALSLSSGAGLAGASATVWAVDGSPTPVVYLSSGGTLSTQTLTSSGLSGSSAWGLPSVPGTAVSDLVMDKSGVLYVASGGQVSAIVTDSPGLNTANNPWPIAGHDACRSWNLEYACPY